MKVTVKIAPKIAASARGFCDIEGKQDIFPPRDIDGKPVMDKEFTLDATPFVEAKIASGELVLLARDEAETIAAADGQGVTIDGEDTGCVLEPGLSDEEKAVLVQDNKKVQKLLKGKKVLDVEITPYGMNIRTKRC